jgi:hypothetical protein
MRKAMLLAPRQPNPVSQFRRLALGLMLLLGTALLPAAAAEGDSPAGIALAHCLSVSRTTCERARTNDTRHHAPSRVFPASSRSYSPRYFNAI